MTNKSANSLKPLVASAVAPLYRLVKQALQKMIETGQYPAGAVLPSEKIICSSLQVSMGTLRRAVDELVHDHVLVRRHGKGTFVALHSPARFMFQFFHAEPRWDFGDDEAMRLQTPAEYPDIECLSFAVGKASASQASALGIKVGESIIKIENRLLLNQRAVMRDQIFLSSVIFKNLNEKTFTRRPSTIYSLYQNDFGITVLRTLERARAVAVDAASARTLGLAAGAPVIEIHRRALTFGDRPVEYRISTLNTQAHDYVNASPAPKP